jgi:hypothetical protein
MTLLDDGRVLALGDTLANICSSARPNVVAHPPPMANWGNITALKPPTAPFNRKFGMKPLVLFPTTGSVLNSLPEKRRQRR